MVDDFLDDSRESPDTIENARKYLNDTSRDIETIDKILVKHAKHWELERLALVDRNILRLGTCELKSRKTPIKVVISEALKLAQEFSTAESPRFVNGVLDAIAKQIEKEQNEV